MARASWTFARSSAPAEWTSSICTGTPAARMMEMNGLD